MKKGYITNIEEATIENDDYRRVLYTSAYSQLVLMNLEPGEEIGEEIHGLDQFIRVEAGTGTAILNKDQEHDLEDGSAVVVPSGTYHNVVNTGDEPLKLYTLYSPPEHKDGVTQASKADEFEEHFDGQITESQ